MEAASVSSHILESHAARDYVLMIVTVTENVTQQRKHAAAQIHITEFHVSYVSVVGHARMEEDVIPGREDVSAKMDGVGSIVLNTNVPTIAQGKEYAGPNQKHPQQYVNAFLDGQAQVVATVIVVHISLAKTVRQGDVTIIAMDLIMEYATPMQTILVNVSMAGLASPAISYHAK
eukprot:CAMPEP_0167744562 /NCGR_PEP_ID=MMETSP0110_2-20121227/2662_1 /TAXON_ID=629695 /ORGANISM="Gymnochlora sp., Strain CCMP2014" /LENGTH=174 /DNA_ID=CAMNT_0007629101 /DNA_START=223 /DNA_END=747 /DNA_ORIENTATION=-